MGAVGNHKAADAHVKLKQQNWMNRDLQIKKCIAIAANNTSQLCDNFHLVFCPKIEPFEYHPSTYRRLTDLRN